jgi:hypothetical protein
MKADILGIDIDQGFDSFGTFNYISCNFIISQSTGFILRSSICQTDEMAILVDVLDYILALFDTKTIILILVLLFFFFRKINTTHSLTLTKKLPRTPIVFKSLETLEVTLVGPSLCFNINRVCLIKLLRLLLLKIKLTKVKAIWPSDLHAVA